MGFCVIKTIDEPLSWAHAASGAAVVSWVLSMHFGIRYVRVTLNILRNNWDFLEAKQFKRIRGNAVDGPTAEAYLSELMKADWKNAGKQTLLMLWQYRTLVLGFILFGVWYAMQVALTEPLELNL